MFRTKASVSFEYKYICNENVTYFILKIWTSGRGEAEGKGVEGGGAHQRTELMRNLKL